MCNLLLAIVSLFNLAPVHDMGYRGEGKTIAVIDCGFYRANDPAIFPQDHIVGVYDLLEGDTTATDTFGIFSDRGNRHGAMCLSTMLYDSEEFTGTAPDAHYILVRTEDLYSEYYGEEERLARAIRMVDSLGADIITISLGYTTFDNGIRSHTYQDMDGTGVAARAATAAARHGKLVCVAAGNEGNKDWQYLVTPGDADSVLTVGATDAEGNPAPFTSYGPSYDGRVKPEVAALGLATTIFNPDDPDGQTIGITTGNGTSFATPQVAGMAACLWQALPTLTAMQLRQLIIESCSNRQLAADCRIGYGEPDAMKAYTTMHTALETVNMHTNGGKRLENGRIVIYRDGIRYSVLGQKL